MRDGLAHQLTRGIELFMDKMKVGFGVVENQNGMMEAFVVSPKGNMKRNIFMGTSWSSKGLDFCEVKNGCRREMMTMCCS